MSCVNPLAATGGVDPETADQIRRRAPVAFLTQERAITMTDYVTVAEPNTQIEDAAASLRWTGSWYTVSSPPSRRRWTLTTAAADSLTQYVKRYRLAGQDINLESPHYVPLEIALTVCVDPDYFQSDVEPRCFKSWAAACCPTAATASSRPKNFALGQTVYLSPIYAGRAGRSPASHRHR